MKISTIALRNAVKAVSTIVPKNAVVPILDGVKIADGYLTATNLEVAVRVPIGFNLPACVLEFATLSAAVNRLTEDEIDFDLKENAAILKCGRTKITVPILGKPEEYPQMIEDPTAPSCVLSRAAVERVASLLPFASTDTLRPGMMGIYFDGVDFCATNGHLLATFKFDGQYNGDTGKETILPARLFHVLFGFTNATEYTFDRGLVTVKRGDEVRAQVRFRRIEDFYPAWRNVVPNFKKNARSEFERDEMVDAIEVLKIGVNKNTQAGVFEFGKGGGVTASSRDIDFGRDATTSIAAANEGFTDTLKIGFNTNFLGAALKFIGGEEVVAYLGGSMQAGIFVNPEFDGFALVMPVSVDHY